MNKIEALAEYAHDAWSGWMVYLFSKSSKNVDGTVTIPKWAVKRWTRQMKTVYKKLSEKERESDRKEASRIYKVVGFNNTELEEANREIMRLKKDNERLFRALQETTEED